MLDALRNSLLSPRTVDNWSFISRESFAMFALIANYVFSFINVYSAVCYLVTEKFLALVPDIMLLAGCEIIVDSTKHAFITKFNNIPSGVYREYTVLLANDVITSRKKNVSFS